MYFDMKVCGRKIRQARKDAGYTQEQLASELGVSTNYLARIESGIRVPPLDLLAGMSSLLDASLDYLVFDKSASRQELEKQIDELIARMEHLKRMSNLS